MSQVNTGISAEHRKQLAEGLSRVLADSYTLYLKTHNYHWNVTGELFHPLHEQFEEQYTELAEAIDVIAERIRALGHKSPGSFLAFQSITSIEEDTEKPSALEMVRRLAVDNEKVLRTAREGLVPAKEADDEATVDLITQRLHVHSKNAWILRSHLEE
jgi:starvation-inducible DNA-binding protein